MLMSNNNLYYKICERIYMHEKIVGNDLRDTNRIVNKLNQDINKNEEQCREWLSDIANRLEAALANEKENQALKERIEELEKENRFLERHLEILREIKDNLIQILIKGD